MLSAYAQQTPVINLWEGLPPKAIQNEAFKELPIMKDGQLQSTEHVTVPSLTVFKPELPNGTAVIICPGGGYQHLAINKEGTKVAQWLNSLGITAFVLKYRLPNDAIMEDKSIGPLQDAQKALRLVRRNAEQFQLDLHKIGIMGFSAGGHLAASLSTQYDKAVYNVEDDTSARPDFSILVYPVISMQEGITHQGSKINLLGVSPSEETVVANSNETLVEASTPTTFIVHATDDASVPVENSIQYYLALKHHKVAAEMHLYEIGGHGFGLGRGDTNQFWTLACEHWLKSNQLID